MGDWSSPEDALKLYKEIILARNLIKLAEKVVAEWETLPQGWDR